MRITQAAFKYLISALWSAEQYRSTGFCFHWCDNGVVREAELNIVCFLSYSVYHCGVCVVMSDLKG